MGTTPPLHPYAHGLQPAQGLYNPAHEKDSCGVGFIAHIKGTPSHQIIQHGLKILANLEHRGAVGADPRAGDGAGMLVQIPHRFFKAEAERLGFALPEPGNYAVGHVFLPRNAEGQQIVRDIFTRLIHEEGQVLLGWREVPTNSDCLGYSVKPTEPFHVQVFIGCGPRIKDRQEFERKLFVLRKVISNLIYDARDERCAGYYPVCLSSRTLVYKGMFLADQLGPYYPDLEHPEFESALALVHQRFSTNTFPTWSLAHPYRMVAHNGEINTLRGNVNWMAAREASVDSDLFANDISRLWPISYEGQSDTACFDNALEFLCQGGYALEHAMMMLIPEAWGNNPLMSEERRAFYEYHAAMMEPWDGPAAMAFTDGRKIGAMLDRNGLRPARYVVTKDDLIVMASEAGVLDIPPEKIVSKWRLQPGRMLLIDLEQGRIVSDDEIKTGLAQKNPYAKWLHRAQIVLEDLPDVPSRAVGSALDLTTRQRLFGYTAEDIKLLMSPMAVTGQEALGSMGTDTPLSVLSLRPKLFYTYFKQNFAQVTNPPIDPIREELVMSLVSFIGPRPNLFDLKGQSRRKRLEVRQPILTNGDLEKIRSIGKNRDNPFDAKTLDATYAVEKGASGMEEALKLLCNRAETAIHGGFTILILSDRAAGPDSIPIPMLLAVAAVHHHLIAKGLRTSVGLVVETGEAREVHHFAALAGYGAEAINPWLAFESLAALKPDFPDEVSPDEIVQRYIKAIDKGLLKVMAKMGISTYQSYCGAQIFDAVGLSKEFVDAYFFGTFTGVGGAGLIEIASETVERHQSAFENGFGGLFRKIPTLTLPFSRGGNTVESGTTVFPPLEKGRVRVGISNENTPTTLDIGGDYAYRIKGEAHAWTPDAVANLQHAVRGNNWATYETYASAMNGRSQALLSLRGLLRIRTASETGRTPVALDEVEPAAAIVKRFSTGAMSFGSLSKEAHETLAVAMNRIGAKSNTGEGGEDARRYIPQPNGDSRRSAIKQIASGRFGVSAHYLVNADVLQIKMAQGAKPGEGGQLPGHKVDATIASVRHSTPGVGLISPPPHHDIYSIEDLAQLVFDLKNVNPAAQISVKLVSEAGVGTVAAGVAKARADHITIAGYEGGTGASPLTAIKHAGCPWEIGLAEAQQTLVINGLRDRISLEVDGGLRTGRDVIIGALLGADNFGFATAPLIAAGCIMMRKCHLNTCPVGVATQDPVLRKRFLGAPEHVINFMFFVAEEVRRLMADIGARRLEELIGRVELLDQSAIINHRKAEALTLKALLHRVEVDDPARLRHTYAQEHHLDDVLDKRLIAASSAVLEKREQSVECHELIRNRDRAAGAMLSGEVARRFGAKGLPEQSIHIHLEGTAGQSFGAFLARGITLDLTGEANDYVGKGLSGGIIVVRPPRDLGLSAHEAIIAGNTVLYGAISGACFLRGQAGERFAVRNSGALAVVEGLGDHGCEYMTGGIVAVLGQTGRNFAAGMSGGIAYVLDEAGDFSTRCNMSMVDLQPVKEEDDLLERLHHHGGDMEFKGRIDLNADLTRFDEERLKQIIEQHLLYTGSDRARQILDDWPHYRPMFVKVMPVDYHRALREMEKKQPVVAAE
jgi:glutamate synthase (NADPH/NADH) large chain